MKLSIVIPIYNGAEAIGRCLDSIYSQTIDQSQFEVICVDDASPDESTAEAVRSYSYGKPSTPRQFITNLTLI